MTSRLVLGNGVFGRALVDRVDSGDLIAVVNDERAEREFTEQGIKVERGDPTNERLLLAFDGRIDSVLIAGDDPQRNLEIATAARSALGTLPIVAYAGQNPTEELTEKLRDVADDVIDRVNPVSSRVLEHVSGPDGKRAQALRGTLREIDGTLAVLAHDSPDPDAIASAIALVSLAESVGVEAVACYFGDINHQENRALVNLLDLDLRALDDPAEIDAFGGIALVDHARAGVNDQLPEDTPIDIVIDHHPPRGPVDGTFVDLRSSAGATSTLLTEYFELLGVELPPDVATALLYGIRIDTDDFTREVSVSDFSAAVTLVSSADVSVLERVESPSVSSETFQTIATAVDNRAVHESVLVSGVGYIGDRDAIAQAADHLLDMEGITTTLVFGIDDGTVYLSGRARGTRIDLGETLRRAFDRIGSAGGHADMAGAQIPVGMLAEPDEDVEEVVRNVITAEFFEALDEIPKRSEFAIESVE